MSGSTEDHLRAALMELERLVPAARREIELLRTRIAHLEAAMTVQRELLELHYPPQPGQQNQ